LPTVHLLRNSHHHVDAFTVTVTSHAHRDCRSALRAVLESARRNATADRPSFSIGCW
jgi:hypothetical protein